MIARVEQAVIDDLLAATSILSVITPHVALKRQAFDAGREA